MRYSSLFPICAAALFISSCAGRALMPQASVTASNQPSELQRWLAEFENSRNLPSELRENWNAAADALYRGAESENSLKSSIQGDSASEKAMEHSMSALAEAAYGKGEEVSGDAENADYPRLLLHLHDPALVLRLIAGSLVEGQPLESSLTEAQPEFASIFENPTEADLDPGFSLYLETIRKAGLDAPISRTLIRRMFFVRPLRAMDLMLEHYPAVLPDTMKIFGVHQGVRLQLMRQSLGEATTQQTLEWMTRALSPLQGHEVWWVRYYARRLLEMQVARGSAPKR